MFRACYLPGCPCSQSQQNSQHGIVDSAQHKTVKEACNRDGRRCFPRACFLPGCSCSPLPESSQQVITIADSVPGCEFQEHKCSDTLSECSLPQHKSTDGLFECG